jgi:hypothetical protein
MPVCCQTVVLSYWFTFLPVVGPLLRFTLGQESDSQAH